jgi:hypothetical protein
MNLSVCQFHKLTNYIDHPEDITDSVPNRDCLSQLRDILSQSVCPNLIVYSDARETNEDGAHKIQTVVRLLSAKSFDDYGETRMHAQVEVKEDFLLISRDDEAKATVYATYRTPRQIIESILTITDTFPDNLDCFSRHY